MLKHKPTHYLLASASLVTFVIVGYTIARHQTATLLSAYFFLFAIYLIVIRPENDLDEEDVNFWIIASIVFRAALLFSMPALSDDFYRFIWDGRMLAAGENPFSHVPSFYMDPSHALPGLDPDLYEKLNSKHRFSSYPPVCQFMYWISVKLSPDSIHGSVLVMKNILLLFEIGTLWLIRRLTPHFNIPAAAVLMYALNPLVILEISGNLHFEGVMVFFLLLAILFLLRNRTVLSTAAYALSVCTKLIPLVILPLLFRALGKKKAIVYWSITGVFTILLYLPLLDTGIIQGYTTSLGYYFQRFEFNASIYYLIRGLGYLIFGFNIIQYAGPLLAIVAAALILRVAFRPTYLSFARALNSDLFKAMSLCLLVYFLSTTILHPWYIITLLAISIFAGYRFPIVWTGVVFLTYAGYTKTAYHENYFFVALEYIIVILWLLFETVWKPRQNHS